MTIDTTTDPPEKTDTTVIQIYRIYIQASPARIWEAITQPDWTEKYYYGTRVDFDLTPGGAYQAVPGPGMLAGAEAMGFELPDVVVQGEVIIADPPHKLAHTWQLLMDPTVEAEGFTTVTWELLPISDDVTKLTVTHDVSGAPATAFMVHGDGEADGNGGGGWDQILSALKTLLETGEPLPIN